MNETFKLFGWPLIRLWITFSDISHLCVFAVSHLRPTNQMLLALLLRLFPSSSFNFNIKPFISLFFVPEPPSLWNKLPLGGCHNFHSNFLLTYPTLACLLSHISGRPIGCSFLSSSACFLTLLLFWNSSFRIKCRSSKSSVRETLFTRWCVHKQSLSLSQLIGGRAQWVNQSEAAQFCWPITASLAIF